MDILAILEDRLGFIGRFYDAAAQPFETTKRKIEANEEPFVPKYAPGDYDGYEYQAEWNEADHCLRMLGHCGLAYVAKALQDYLREFITREAGVPRADIGTVLPKPKKKESWLHRFTRFLEDKTAFCWSDSPVGFAQLEEINLARNVIWHDESIDGTWPMQTDDYAEKFPAPHFW
jgi:hypothetical protein